MKQQQQLPKKHGKILPNALDSDGKVSGYVTQNFIKHTGKMP